MNLYVDITELASWRGKLTGVPRVMNELTSRFAGDGSVIFVKWDGMSKSLIETDLPTLTEAHLTLSKNKANSTSVTRRVFRKVAYSSSITKGIVGRLQKLGKNTFKSRDGVLLKRTVNLKAGDTLLVLAD